MLFEMIGYSARNFAVNQTAKLNCGLLKMKLSSLAGLPHGLQKGSDLLNQTKFFFPLIFISLEDDSSIVIPPQPTSPGEIMSGGEGEPVENLNGYLLPYDSPYLKANIEYLGNLYWDNNTEEYWLAMTKCSLISLFLSSKIPAAGILGAAATFLDVFNHFFGEDTPSDAWHDFYKVSIDVYIETSDFVGISHREYIYVWANNSPTSAFWYQVPTANCTGGNS